MEKWVGKARLIPTSQKSHLEGSLPRLQGTSEAAESQVSTRAFAETRFCDAVSPGGILAQETILRSTPTKKEGFCFAKHIIVAMNHTTMHNRELAYSQGYLSQ